MRARNTTETLFWLITLGGGMIGRVLGIHAHERLSWTNADVLKFAIAATVGVGSICGFVIWQLGDYTSQPHVEDEDFVGMPIHLRSFVGRPVVGGRRYGVISSLGSPSITWAVGRCLRSGQG